MRYRKDLISKHLTHDVERFVNHTPMGRLIQTNELSPQPVDEPGLGYTGLVEDEFIAPNAPMAAVTPVVHTDTGLGDLPRPGSLFPNGDAY